MLQSQTTNSGGVKTYQEEALEVALVCEDILQNNPVVMTLVRLLLMTELGVYFLILGLDIRMIRRKLSQLGEILQALLRLAVVDKEARCFRDQRNHDTHETTWNKLNACQNISGSLLTIPVYEDIPIAVLH